MPSGQITSQLRQWREGDREALDRLTPLVYERLRVLAGTYLGREKDDHPLQPTELVNELFVDLLRLKRVEIGDRNHFFALAARVMRQILVRHARTTQAERRGGHVVTLPLDAELAWTGGESGDPTALDLNGVMDELEKLDEAAVRAVELRYFFGFTANEAAKVLGTSKATVDRQVRFALAWLHSRLHPEV